MAKKMANSGKLLLGKRRGAACTVELFGTVINQLVLQPSKSHSML